MEDFLLRGTFYECRTFTVSRNVIHPTGFSIIEKVYNSKGEGIS